MRRHLTVLHIIDISIALYLSRLPRPPVILHPPQLAQHCRAQRGNTFVKSSRSWIPQQSIICSMFIVDKRTDVGGIVIEPVLMSSLHVVKSQLRSIRWAEEIACHSIERFEVQSNVVLVDMWGKDWTMALRSCSLMFWLWSACTLGFCIGFCLRAGGRTVSNNVERIRR